MAGARAMTCSRAPPRLPTRPIDSFTALGEMAAPRYFAGFFVVHDDVAACATGFWKSCG